MENFSNNFLISMPHLNDSIFNKSLIYVCEHNKLGAMGLIINKPMSPENIQNILIEIGLEQLKPSVEVYFGGPVQVETGMILHDNKYQTNDTINISKSISLSSNINIINDIKNGAGPNEYKLTLGYAGWDAGQLEDEIQNGDWLMIPSEYDLIFNTPASEIFAKIKSLINVENLSGGQSGLS